MAVCSLGSGYGWSIQDGPRWYDTSSGGHRQVYQVDTSSSDKKAGWSDCSPVYGRHHKQIWCAKASSPTMTQILQRGRWHDMRPSTTFVSTSHPWHILS